MANGSKEMWKFLGLHLACGVVASFIFGAAILVSDLSHIRSLALESDHPMMILVLMFFGLAVCFGSLAMGVGIMGMGNFSESNRHLKDEE